MTTLEKLQCFFLDLMYKNYVSKKYMINCKVDEDILVRLDRYIFLLEYGCEISNEIQCDINSIISFNEDFVRCMVEASFCGNEGITTELCVVEITAPDDEDLEPEACSVINITELP